MSDMGDLAEKFGLYFFLLMLGIGLLKFVLLELIAPGIDKVCDALDWLGEKLQKLERRSK